MARRPATPRSLRSGYVYRAGRPAGDRVAPHCRLHFGQATIRRGRLRNGAAFAAARLWRFLSARDVVRKDRRRGGWLV